MSRDPGDASQAPPASRGVLYVCTGRSHIQAAMRSARSVQRTNPGLPTHLFADLERQQLSFQAEAAPFTSWGDISEPRPLSKVEYMARSPFEWTLFLDADTRVLTDLADGFRLLERFDIAMAHAHRREMPAQQAALQLPVPLAFPEFNTGVIFYRRNAATAVALDLWSRRFRASKLDVDQPALREVLWSGDLRIATLPPEYNVRYLKYLLVWGKDEATPKILHRGVYHGGLRWYVSRWGRSIVGALVRR